MLKLKISFFICLIVLLSGCEKEIQNQNIQANISSDLNLKKDDSKASDISEVNTQEIIDLLSKIPQEVYENAVYYNTDIPIEDKDKIFILAQSENKNISVYGYESLNYGRRGTVVDYKIGRENHYNYFDFNWSPYYREPLLSVFDYDNDGKEEIAFCVQEYNGTGINIQQLIIFEILDTGYLDAYKFDSEQQIKEITKLVNCEVDKENGKVNLISSTKEKNCILDISFEQAKEISIEAVDYSSQLTFDIGNRITMNVYPGLRIKDQASTYYDDSKQQILSFDVMYSHDNNLNGGHFILNLIN